MRRTAAVVTLVLAIGACTTAVPPQAGSTPSPLPSTPGPHVFVIVFENLAYRQIAGNADAAFMNRLAQEYSPATDYHGITHPSLPNYLAMTGGDTFGVTRNCTGCRVSAPSIAGQLQAKGLSWRVYAEGLPSPCYRGGERGRYVKRHNPFLYYDDVTANEAACRDHVVSFDALEPDLRAGPPNLSFIVPDLCTDMHDCNPAAGDAWLARIVPAITATAAWRDGGVLVVTFDEGNASPTNHVFTVVARPGRPKGERITARMDHYSLLRAIEDTFGLPHLRNAATATSLW